MWKVYNIIYFNILSFFKFTEELSGGKDAQIKSYVLLTMVNGLNLLSLLVYLRKYNISNAYNYISANIIISGIIIFVIFYMMHHILYSKFKSEKKIIAMVKRNKSFRIFSYTVTVAYFLLSLQNNVCITSKSTRPLRSIRVWFVKFMFESLFKLFVKVKFNSEK